MGDLYLAVPRPSLCVGIDLAGVPHRETGLAVLRDGRLERLTSVGDDDEILALLAGLDGQATLAINAPLGLPRGRCCLDDGCACRHDPGTRSRQSERELLGMGVPILATALIKVLARRGIALGATLRRAGWAPLEVYPYATLRLLGLPHQGKRTKLGRRRIYEALRPLAPGLDHEDASEHQLDAVVCALTAQLWRQGRTRTVGMADEGLMVIPDLPAASALDRPGPAVRRAAESSVPYTTDASRPASPRRRKTKGAQPPSSGIAPAPGGTV